VNSDAVLTRFTTSTEYDALNRVTKSSAPDGSTNVPVYNRANFLERMLVTAGTETRAAVHSMAYNEKGQRLFCEYSAQAATTSTPAYSTTYTYDEKTFRLKTLVTRRTDNNLVLQSLSYTYDPVGNITEILDTGTPVAIYASPVAAEANGKYEYDALYRLVLAQGREHPGQQVSYTDLRADELPTALPNGNDTSGLIRYEETYQYDAVGNIRRVHHQPLASGYQAWERRYRYAYQAKLDGEDVTASNRLLATSVAGVDDSTGGYSARYEYSELPDNNAGLHGSMRSMPHLPAIYWDYADRMRRCATTVGTDPGTVYFTYDASGQRTRKVWNHSGLREERIYLGGYEVFRRWSVGATPAQDELKVHRTTLHVMDDQRRVAMVENTIVDTVENVSAGRRWRCRRKGHQLRGVSSVRDECAAGAGFDGWGVAEAVPVYGQRTRRGDVALLPRGAVLRAVAGTVDGGGSTRGGAAGETGFEFVCVRRCARFEPLRSKRNERRIRGTAGTSATIRWPS
jgi:YD repeat-containing protein